MLKISNLYKKYNDFTAVNNLNLEIESGEIFCLLGQNGAGKTTTINMIMGFVANSGGTISVNGIDVQKDAVESKKHLAYLPENVMLYPHLTGMENLAFFARLAGFNHSGLELREYLMEADLSESAFDKRLSTYSKGMRQKVGIAIALAKNADVLILDEPTSGLDPKASNDFSELLLELKNKGKAVFMATHDIFQAVKVATRIGIMKQGQLVAVLHASDINANELENLYLQTV